MNKLRLKNRQSLYLLMLILAFGAFGCRRAEETTLAGQETGAADAPTEESFDTTASNINLAAPLKISTQPKDVEKCRQMNETIDKSPFSDARWGMMVVGLKDGRIVCGRDAQKLFSPASVLKILVSVVALDKLGADFRWRTSVYASKNIENGTLNGDLILYGRGAPDFNQTKIEELVAQLQAKGLKNITGKIIADDGYFVGDSFGDGWAWNDLQWYYGAEASALTVNHNEIGVGVKDGKPNVYPESNYIRARVSVQPPAGKPAIGIRRELGSNDFYVWGEGDNVGSRAAVINPAQWAATILREKLTAKGITVGGATESKNWTAENKTNVESLTEIAAAESQTLGETVNYLNKHSFNLFAELILRSLGKQFGDAAPDPSATTQKTRGTDAAGVAVVKQWLAAHNIGFQETEMIKDGSGLSRLNLITPETLVRALIAGGQIGAASVFKDSLPIAGTDGTLGGRLGSVKGRIIAKTGSIAYVNSLAGYARGDDETFVFAIICNNQTKRGRVTDVIDAAVTRLIKEKPAEGAGAKSVNKNSEKEEKPENEK